MKTIQLDDIISQAFIVYLRKTGKRSLSLSKIDSFGTTVVKYLKRKGEKVRLGMPTNIFENSEYFLYNEQENMIELKPDVTEEELIEKFCGYINYEVLLAFRNEENTKVLFEE